MSGGEIEYKEIYTEQCITVLKFKLFDISFREKVENFVIFNFKTIKLFSRRQRTL